MASNAVEYADSIINRIREATDEGAPFGWTSSVDSVGTYDTRAEAIEQGSDPDDVVEASGLDYLEGVLDIHYVIGSDREYRGARVCVALGSPTAWINTYTGELEVSWWSAPETRELPKDFIDGLDDALSDLWEMR